MLFLDKRAATQGVYSTVKDDISYEKGIIHSGFSIGKRMVFVLHSQIF